MNEQELQVLRNITREHIRSLAREGFLTFEEIYDVECVRVALRLMKQYNFKQDRPL